MNTPIFFLHEFAGLPRRETPRSEGSRQQPDDVPGGSVRALERVARSHTTP